MQPNVDIKSILEKRGLTQGDAARAMGVDKSVFSRWLKWRVPADDGQCLRLSQYLGVGPHEIRPDIYPAPQGEVSNG